MALFQLMWMRLKIYVHNLLGIVHHSNKDTIYTQKEIYPHELTLNKTNSRNNKSSFLDFDLTVENSVVITKNYDKRYDFDFDIVTIPHFNGDVPKSTFYGV